MFIIRSFKECFFWREFVASYMAGVNLMVGLSTLYYTFMDIPKEEFLHNFVLSSFIGLIVGSGIYLWRWWGHATNRWDVNEK
jgi:hypothetical protein